MQHQKLKEGSYPIKSNSNIDKLFLVIIIFNISNFLFVGWLVIAYTFYTFLSDIKSWQLTSLNSASQWEHENHEHFYYTLLY